MTKVQEELRHVLNLLQIEKKADMEYYRQKVLNTSLEQRKKDGVSWYPVVLAGRHFNMGEKLVVKVERTTALNRPHVFQSGKVVSLFANSNGKQNLTLSGVVNEVKGNTMAITLNVDELPDWAEQEKLGVDLLFDEQSYREMENALKNVIHTHEARIIALREILSGNDVPEFINTQPATIPHLNGSQNEALNKILSARDVAIVHGPPGTGKTTTLVQAIYQTLKQEKQALVCAPSNAAVDLLTEKLSEQGLSVIRIGHPARVTESNLSKTMDAQIANHSYYKDLRVIKRKAEEYCEMGSKYKRSFGYAEREQRRLLLAEAKKAREDARQLEDYIVADLLSKADIITTTLVGAANNLIRGMSFKTVFIDEASQALEPACWIPVLKANRVVMAGDHFQLPPTVKSIEAARNGLAQTLFEKCIEKKKKAGTPVDVMLKTQYRMHEKIMRFSASYFYRDELEAADSVRAAVLSPQIPPVTFIDTAGCGYTEQLEKESLSTYNEEEGRLLLKHLSDLVTEISPETILAENLTIGIITPYRAQVRFLSEILGDYEALTAISSQLTIDSVDAFQGRERDIIYISMVRSNDKGEIGFLSDTRRMNVAMTRARKRLVMVGDSATLGGNAFYHQMLDYITDIEAYQSAFELIY